MKQEYKNVKNIVLSAMFIALGFVLPFMTGQVPKIGNMLCPMHIPVLLCGFLCGPLSGVAVGFVSPLFRTAVLGMPPLFPNSVSMAFELAVYGFISGILHRIFPKKKIYIYLTLLCSMVAGRVVWGLVQFFLMGLDSSVFGFNAFVTAAVTDAIPGIVLQLTVIPILVIVLEKTDFFKNKN